MKNPSKLPRSKKVINIEEAKNKKGNIVMFTEIVRKHALQVGTAVLSAAAICFASTACLGHFHEPEVPEQLRN